MRDAFAVGCWLTVVGIAASAMGHGNPIEISVVDGRLTVAVGLTLVDGYTDLSSDPHEDAALDFGPNQKLRSTYPGFDIAGLESDTPLEFEVIGRPDFSTTGRPTRWLWYWNGATQLVENVPNDLRFDVSPLFGSGSIQVRQSSVILGPTLTAANPVGPFLGNDQHLLIYELQNSPSAPFGAYGVVARFKSPGLESSAPFLLVFRYGVAAEDFSVASEAINAAAGLAGDFDVDGDVDGADFLLWQRTMGTAGTPGSYPAADASMDGNVNGTDLAIWRNEFGRLVSAATPASSGVPEPATGWGLVLGAAGTSMLLRRRFPHGNHQAALP